jgi:hypothetical protein
MSELRIDVEGSSAHRLDDAFLSALGSETLDSDVSGKRQTVRPNVL